MTAAGGGDIAAAVAVLGAAVVAVPVFKRLGLGAVLGYLAAGMAIGPFGAGLFAHPQAVLHVAELGVVMLLFLIGLELKPSRLWALRRDIFGLGLAQVVACSAAIGAVAAAYGLGGRSAVIAASGFALSSTAIVLQLLEERGETTTTHGQKTFAVLLFQDIAIVPLLAVVAFLAPASIDDGAPIWLQAATAAGAVLAVVAAGRWLLNPVFRLLARADAREIMTAAALLVVLGAALLMQAGGLSMAMGAFIAGVVLSESSFRHQLEADIEPFRGLLLGLFFLGVGMSIDLILVADSWRFLIGAVIALMVLKGAVTYLVARSFGSPHGEATRLALMLAQGGEFAFVLYAAAAGAGLLAPAIAAPLTAAVAISMALTPLTLGLTRLLAPPEPESMDGVEHADGLRATALVIGFGRFGQMASQVLLARGFDVSIIDNSPDRIREAARFGFKIYYGDGTRLDVLRASGAGRALVVAVCVDDRRAASRIVELVHSELPFAKLHVRSFDRGHTLELLAAGADYEIRETLESALAFGRATLEALGIEPEVAEETVTEVRRRDLERLARQQAEGIYAGMDMVPGAHPTPEPLTKPRRDARALNEEAADLAECEKDEAVE